MHVVVRVQWQLEHAAVGEQPVGIPAVVHLHTFIPASNVPCSLGLAVRTLHFGPCSLGPQVMNFACKVIHLTKCIEAKPVHFASIDAGHICSPTHQSTDALKRQPYKWHHVKHA